MNNMETQLEKLKSIVDSLCIYVNATSAKCRHFKKDFGSLKWGYTGHPAYTIITNDYDLTNFPAYRCPYSDITVELDRDKIIIKGKNCEYQISVDQLMTIQKRLQKIK